MTLVASTEASTPAGSPSLPFMFYGGPTGPNKTNQPVVTTKPTVHKQTQRDESIKEDKRVCDLHLQGVEETQVNVSKLL